MMLQYFMSSGIPACFELLEIPETRELHTIRKSYLQLVKQYHPDINPDNDTEKIKAINNAYEEILEWLNELEKEIIRVRVHDTSGGFDPTDYYRYFLNLRKLFVKYFSFNKVRLSANEALGLNNDLIDPLIQILASLKNDLLSHDEEHPFLLYYIVEFQNYLSMPIYVGRIYHKDDLMSERKSFKLFHEIKSHTDRLLETVFIESKHYLFKKHHLNRINDRLATIGKMIDEIQDKYPGERWTRSAAGIRSHNNLISEHLDFIADCMKHYYTKTPGTIDTDLSKIFKKI